MIRDLLCTRFPGAFDGARPAVAVHAPGRVNLIGEHVDYCGLPVFPMALQRGVGVAARRRADAVMRVANVEARFAPRTFSVTRDIPPREPGDWGNYLQAAAQAVARRYGELPGIEALVGSDLPLAAGLSSSAALVVGAAVALLAANGMTFDRAELAAVLAEGERYVGTAGGGMDQAISLGARAGHAARVDFDPVRLTHVAVPADWRFVVAGSLVPAEKSGRARQAYNARTQETAAAREGIARYMNIPDVASYADLFAARPVEELLDAAGRLEPLLRRRYRHVVSEGARVYQAERAMRAARPEEFGALMDASHASLRDDYEVSHPALDRLVEVAREAGALGARLTGAGFGGCIVALVSAAGVATALGEIQERFYFTQNVRDTHDALFVAEPSAGASADAVA